MLAMSGAALAIVLRAGPIEVVGEGGFSPTTLPKRSFAPITLHGEGRIGTTDGSLPPILKTLTVWFDKHGEVVTEGLPVCTKGKLLATTTKTARRVCAGSIVGEGYGTALIAFPEQRPFKASSPITIFNGPPHNGNPTVLAHAYLSVPAPTTYIVPVEIQKVNNGPFGFRTEATIPRIAGGSGIPLEGRLTIGKKWTYKGKKLSYANASCPSGKLQAKVETEFTDSTKLSGLILKPCKGKN
ncbi:MAG: hypothetical protein BGO11_03175 [Solirubrobacterales bacterium 70-9]|nr:MAG: hypothetical protein BGO11_03175 [Solirubrobacterales bacterium 70-9]